MKPKPNPEEQAFQKAIRYKPDARAIRLVYADWLDERNDPRGELIRIEEEMRTAAIYSDVCWQLKPRRRELLKAIEKPWLKQMGYGGTDYQPVFADIPDGWRERWRLLREFVERWYQIPMDDVGGPLKPIPPESPLLGQGFHDTIDAAVNDPKVFESIPPSVREWMYFLRDLFILRPEFDRGSGNDQVFWDEKDRMSFMSLDGSRELLYVRDANRNEPDPPVWRDARHRWKTIDESKQFAPTVTLLALHHQLTRYRMDAGEGEYDQQKMTKSFARCLEKCFPVRSHFDDVQLFERPNVVAFWTQESRFEGESPCFRLLGRTRKAWEEAMADLYVEDS